MNTKLAVLGFVLTMVVWFGLVAGTLVGLDRVGQNELAMKASSTAAPGALVTSTANDAGHSIAASQKQAARPGESGM